MNQRPNTKGLVSRDFRVTCIAARIISIQTEDIRTEEMEILDKSDPVRYARSVIRLRPGEMIFRVDIISDRHVIKSMTKEEFYYSSREIPYKIRKD